MVKIAVAGGTGEVGREVLDALVAAGKHEITVLVRNNTKPKDDSLEALTWRRVDYLNPSELVDSLRGIHTVLSFLQLSTDGGHQAQKNLIDASIAAGVKRFAPSEWGSVSTAGLSWWERKNEAREYLEKVNRNGKVLEYTLFQPGLFLNYLAAPHKTARHLTPLNTMIDFENCRAIVVEDYDAIMTFTTVQDVAAVVTMAVDCEDDWPTVGGIRGNRMPISQILEVGERVRGRPFTVDRVKLEDLEQGKLTASWGLEAQHPAFSPEEASQFLRVVLIGTLISSAKGAWDVSDEMNRLFPDFKFNNIKDFLEMVWEKELSGE